MPTKSACDIVHGTYTKNVMSYSPSSTLLVSIMNTICYEMVSNKLYGWITATHFRARIPSRHFHALYNW